jgi:hypothetical protein
MNVTELRDLDEARAFLVQGLWLQRLTVPGQETTAQVLNWAMEIVSSDHWLPPLGFLGDLGQSLLATQAGPRSGALPSVPGFPPGLIRAYEDYVLGKLAADFTLERAGDALRRYQGRDQARGLAFVLRQLRQRADFAVVSLSPAVVKSLLREPPARVLNEGWESLLRGGPVPELLAGYESLVRVARQAAELLGPEDLFELEHGTALAEFGQRVALRQALRAAETLEQMVSPHRPTPPAGRREIPTRVLDEDTYPVGGFSSLSTRGTIESLLQSQLALMEKIERPDLFDVKFVRDELLYYSRDENSFLRRRRTFVFVLYPDLVQARFKDPGLPWQRIVLLLGLLLVTVRKLCEWLSADALRFEVLLLGADEPGHPLADERELLRTLLREQLANGTVALETAASAGAVARRCALHGRRSLCHCLTIGMMPHRLVAAETQVSSLNLAGARPVLKTEEEEDNIESDDLLEAWARALDQLLAEWI